MPSGPSQPFTRSINSKRRQETKYTLAFQMLPPTLQCWKALKDFVRRYAPSVGKTEVYSGPTRRSYRYGLTDCTSCAEAENLYGKLLRVKLLQVFDPHIQTAALANMCIIHLFDTSQDARLLKSNCDPQVCNSCHGLKTTYVEASYSGLPRVSGTSLRTSSARSGPTGYGTTAIAHSSTGTSSRANYVAGNDGRPVNANYGVRTMTNTRVFITKLNFATTETHIAAKFQEVQGFREAHIAREQGGRSLGRATVMYDSAHRAREAVQRFDGLHFMNKRINVRLDREAFDGSEPLIVDGSIPEPIRRA
ncbi:MAG: hypothetical protein M1828_001011 [Chrysothrix sp. TS-e1954]|nr:MAG: hypothetical protein M1828_001011 [Chrysothrix sp. TS-e1954]